MPLFSGNMFQPWHCIPDILDTSHSHVLLGIAWSSRHHSQELIFKPMEAFQERLGDGKSEVVLCFQAVFFCFVDQKALRLIGNVFNTLINLENVFLSNFIYILLFTYYIYMAYTLSAFSTLEIPTVWGTTEKNPKRPRCHVERFDDQHIGLHKADIFYGYFLTAYWKSERPKLRELWHLFLEVLLTWNRTLEKKHTSHTQGCEDLDDLWEWNLRELHRLYFDPA